MSRECEHGDVRYFKGEHGAVACVVCGRLFGHLVGETFRAFNPESAGCRCRTARGPICPGCRVGPPGTVRAVTPLGPKR